MKIFGVGDALLPGKYVKNGLNQFMERGDVVTVISWGEDDEEIIDQRARNLELNGPTADTPPEELEQSIADIELLMVHYCPVSEALLRKGNKLKILATCRMGTQNIDVAAATQLGILTFHVIGRTTEAVSDLTIGLMLCEARNIARAHKAMTDGSWRKVYLNSATAPELEAKTVGLIGFGEVGRAVLRKLKCFNMQFKVYDPFAPEPEIMKLGGQPADLDTLLATSDFISLHAAVTEKSNNMIDKRELSLMKPTAYLINTARSELINEQALYEALKDQRISGAAMDVFKDEPLPGNHPFLQLDNVTLTPHIASSTLECLAKSPQLLADAILEFFETGSSRFIVNPELLEKFPADHFKNHGL
jgi:D-3-phosphoglycerate dehydrogenase